MLRTIQDRLEFNTNSSLRDALFDNHVLTNETFRKGYDTVARHVLQYALENDLEQIVEMGAGTAPITQLLANMPEAKHLRLKPCDRTPHVEHYQELSDQYPNVEPISTSVDFTDCPDFGPKSLLLLLGTFPAVPLEYRQKALESLTRNSQRVMVWEYVRKTPLSMFFASFTFFVALLLPLAYLFRPGRFRRFFWCWLFPILPFIVAWDGVTWCRRAWTDREWSNALERLDDSSRIPSIESYANSQLAIW